MSSPPSIPFLDTPAMDTLRDDDIPSDTTTTIAPLGNKHTHKFIFLHGREDFGQDLAQYFFDSKASDGRSLAEMFPSMKWVFPTAKLRYSAQRDHEFSTSSFAESLKGEEIISQWFDVWDINVPSFKQELMIPGLRESIEDIVDIVQEEAEAVPLDRIFLGGISQGCATAIYALLSSGTKLGGFVGLSSWLPFQNTLQNITWSSDISNDEISRHIHQILQIPEDLVPNTRSCDTDELEATLSSLTVSQPPVTRTRVFLSHSRDDETVPLTHGQGLYENIKNLGFDVTWREYEDGGHWIHPEHGVDDISSFLHEVIGL